MFRIHLFSKIGLVISLTLSAPIFAQNNENDSPVNSLENLEVIEVTARKTLENIQSIPVSVTAFNAQIIEEKGIEILSEIQQFSPNTSLLPGTATNSTINAFMRGVGQEDQLWGYEPAVGIYVDDVYYARPQGAVLQILDIDRIELLRGPQGTLYGKNTIGGAVKFITRPLSGDKEFMINGSLGSFAKSDLKLSGQLPISDKLRFGIAAATFNQEGFGEFLTSALPSQDAQNYNKELYTYRVKLEYHNTKVSAKLNYDRTDDDSNARGGHRVLDSVLPVNMDVEPIPSDVFDASTSLPTWNELTTEGTSLVISLPLSDELHLKSVTAKRENYSRANIDFDNTSLRIFDIPAIYDDEQFTQEIQFNYHGDNLSLVSGIYYYDADACGSYNAIIDVLGNLMELPGFTIETSGCSKSKSGAVYAQGNYELNASLALSVGARYTEEEKTAFVNNGAVFQTLYPENGWVPGFVRDETLISTSVPRVLDGKKSWSRFTPSISLSYQANKDLMWYASYAQGFKSGMFNPRAAHQEPAVDPEILDSIEIGFKSQLSNQLRLNATIFALSHKDRQFVTVLEGDGSGDLDQRLGNIGKSEAFGAEVEARYLLTPNLNTYMTLGIIDSDFVKATTYNGTGYDDISDRFSIINTPDVNANLGFDYNFDSRYGQYSFNGNYYYRSDYDLIVLDNLQTQSDFGLANFSFNWFSRSGQWRSGLHIKNAFDKRYLSGSFAFVTKDENGEYVPGFAGDNILNAYYGEPRTWALDLEYRF